MNFKDFKDYKYVIPIILIIVFCFIVSIFLINYFKIDVNDNSGLVKLNKVAVYEGLNNEDTKNYDIFSNALSKSRDKKDIDDE